MWSASIFFHAISKGGIKFFLAAFVDGPWPGTPIELDFKIGVINNYDNDRERYMDAYEEAYKSLTKVPELSEWQT